MSELVSFPCWLGKYRESCFAGHPRRLIGPKYGSDLSSLGRDSLRFGTGNLFGLSRELEEAIRELESLVREFGLSGVKLNLRVHARILVCPQLNAEVRRSI